MIKTSVLVVASVLLFGTTAMAQKSEPVAKEATVFSYKLHYLEAGRGAPVILLHGSGGEGAGRIERPSTHRPNLVSLAVCVSITFHDIDNRDGALGAPKPATANTA